MIFVKQKNIIINLEKVKTITQNGNAIYFNYENSNPISIDLVNEEEAKGVLNLIFENGNQNLRLMDSESLTKEVEDKTK